MTPTADKIASQWGWEPSKFTEFIERLTNDLDAWVDNAKCTEYWLGPSGPPKSAAHRAQYKKLLTHIETIEPMLDPTNKVYTTSEPNYTYNHGEIGRHVLRMCQSNSARRPNKKKALATKNTGGRKRVADAAFAPVERGLFQTPTTIRIFPRNSSGARAVKTVTVSSEGIEKPADLIAHIVANTTEHPAFNRAARNPGAQWVMFGFYDRKLDEDEIEELSPVDSAGNPVSHEVQSCAITDRNSLQNYCSQWESAEPIDPAKPKKLPLIRAQVLTGDDVSANEFSVVDLTEPSFKRSRMTTPGLVVGGDAPPSLNTAEVAEQRRLEKAAAEEAERVLGRADRIKTHKEPFEAAVRAAKAALSEPKTRGNARDARVQAEYAKIDALMAKKKSAAMLLHEDVPAAERDAPDSDYMKSIAAVEKKAAEDKANVDAAHPVPVLGQEELDELEKKIKDAESALAALTDDFYNPEGYPINEDTT